MPFRRKAPAGDAPLDPERQSRVKGIFEDLLNLEINVIVTPGMTARKMPEPAEAFRDVAIAYSDLLVSFSNEVRAGLRGTGEHGKVKVPEAPAVAPPELSMVDRDGHVRAPEPAVLASAVPAAPSLELFEGLESRAKQAWAVACELVAVLTARVEAGQAMPGWPTPKEVNERVVLLKRLYGNCQQLTQILVDVGMTGSVAMARDVALSAEQLITLRKIWEVGIATVVMQTVVQIDGDIVTRIHGGHTAASSSTLHGLHREAVGSAMQNWQFLGQTLAQFVQSSLRNLL